MSFISEYRIEVLDSFEALKAALNSFEGAFCCQQEQRLPAWFQESSQLTFPTLGSHREKAFYFFNQLEYLNSQAPRDILMGPGVFAASEETLEAVKSVNLCKERFKKAVLDLKQAKIPLSHNDFTDYFENSLGRRPSTLAQPFRKMGFARLHLKQCYRLIPCLIERPTTVSWTWIHTKSIKRITVQEAKQLLIKQGMDLGIETQLSKLNTLSSKDPLAIVQNLAPLLRANIVIRKGNTTTRSMIKGSVPLFYPMAEGQGLPALFPAFEKQARNGSRALRSDVKLEPQPFLSAIHAHRYLERPL